MAGKEYECVKMIPPSLFDVLLLPIPAYDSAAEQKSTSATRNTIVGDHKHDTNVSRRKIDQVRSLPTAWFLTMVEGTCAMSTYLPEPSSGEVHGRRTIDADTCSTRSLLFLHQALHVAANEFEILDICTHLQTLL